MKYFIYVMFFIIVSIALSCEKKPTTPKLIDDKEMSNIPFDRLSGKIAFRRVLTDVPNQFYFMLLDAEQKTLRGICYFDAYIPTNLSLSPDGTQLLFSYFVYEGLIGNYVWQLYIMTMETLQLRNITSSLADDSFGAWSPDGKRIAFWSNRSLKSSMWLVDLDQDTSYHLVDIDNITRTRPAWFSDGNSLMFASTDSNFKASFFKLNLLSSTIEPIYTDELTTSDVIFKHPSISTDNNFLTFVKSYKNKSDEIWILNLTTTNATRMTTGYADWHPTWSPDGHQILFSRGRHLYLMDREGGNLTQVTFGEHTDEYPSWIL